MYLMKHYKRKLRRKYGNNWRCQFSSYSLKVTPCHQCGEDLPETHIAVGIGMSRERYDDKERFCSRTCLYDFLDVEAPDDPRVLMSEIRSMEGHVTARPLSSLDGGWDNSSSTTIGGETVRGLIIKATPYETEL